MNTIPSILYVDDETDLLELAASFFEDEGLKLETCPEFGRAIELIKSKRYDVIITDAKMPGGSGFELIRILREDLNHTGLIILATGSLQEAESQQGYDEVVHKPIDFLSLIDRVKKYLA